MKEASEHIDDLISEIDSTIDVSYDAGSGRSLTCKTKWVRIGSIVTDSQGNEFEVTEVVDDEYIVAGDADGVLNIPNPFFATGTKLATNSEWTMADPNLNNKTPLVWLLEIISERGYGRGSTFDSEIDVRMFFLDQTDPTQYYTKDHRKNVVKPMQKLMKAFLDVVEKNRNYQTVEDYRFKTFARFGEESDRGVLRNILDANLSGVALELNLTRYKENCKC